MTGCSQFLLRPETHVADRARAFLARHPDEGWAILQQLIRSGDPDDRDTALSVLVVLSDPRGPAIAKLLLHDPWPYLQFDAIDCGHADRIFTDWRAHLRYR